MSTLTFDRPTLQRELERDEGRRAQAYDDATGKTVSPGTAVAGWVSIGTGRNLVGRGITDVERVYLLMNDIDGIAAELDRLIPWWRRLDGVRQRALVNLGMMGTGALMGFHQMLGALERGDWPAAKAELLDSDYARELPERAGRLADMLLTGMAPPL